MGQSKIAQNIKNDQLIKKKKAQCLISLISENKAVGSDNKNTFSNTQGQCSNTVTQIIYYFQIIRFTFEMTFSFKNICYPLTF